jgi:hypothetical protein
MTRLLSIPFAEYQALAGVNWSTLGKMRASPAHYLHATTAHREPTAAQATGSAVHTLVLEPGEFAARYAVYDGEGTRASKEYKAFAAEVAECVTIIKRGEMDEINAMATAIDVHPAAGPLFNSGWAERSFTWSDTVTGIECKGRTDWLCADGIVSGDAGQPDRQRVILVDLKTSRSTDPREFGRDAARYGYHLQLAHYAAGLRANGLEVSQVLVVVVETEAPWDVCVFEITDDQLAVATAEVAALLERVKECRASGEWPGRSSEITPLDLPAWVIGSDDVAVLWGAT